MLVINKVVKPFTTDLYRPTDGFVTVEMFIRFVSHALLLFSEDNWSSGR